MRSLLFIGGGILLGVAMTHAEAELRAEKKIREAEASYWKQWGDHLDDNYVAVAEAPVASEEELIFNPEGAILEQDELPPGYVQEYVEKAAVYGDNAHMVQAQPMEIIDDDMYAEEDGRGKEQIQVFMGDGEPYYVQDGMVIEDWREKIGDNILVTLYQTFPPDFKGERILYVRNHERGEDFEIVQEMGP